MKKTFILLVLSLIILTSCNKKVKTQEDYIRAISDYTKSIELDPNNVDTYLLRAESKRNLKDYSGAIADYTKAIELNPNNANTFINRAIGKVGLKDYDGAIADYTKAIELNPNDAIAYYSRGYIKSFWGLDSEACQDIRKAQKLGVDVKELIDVCN